jgi:hypothetical protein
MLHRNSLLLDRVRRRGPAWLATVRSCAMVCLLSSLLACTPSLYSVSLQYEPSAIVIPTADKAQKLIVTVALFNDARPGGEDLQIGKVTTAAGGRYTVLPRNLKPGAAVSAIVKDILVKSGYRVSVAVPAWNLKEDAVRKEWGRILVGGNIEALEIACQSDVPIISYRSHVKLSFAFADVMTGRIFYRATTESNNTLEHVYFTEDLLGQQISIAISEAAEKAFEGGTLKEKIREVLRQNP